MTLHIHLLDGGANINSKSQQMLPYQIAYLPYALVSNREVRILLTS